MTSKTDKVDHKVQEVAPPNAWRIAAPRSCKFELQDRDEAFAFGGIKPGDAMLLMILAFIRVAIGVSTRCRPWNLVQRNIIFPASSIQNLGMPF